MWLIFLLCATTCACRYTTKASKEKEVGCFQEQIRLPHGEALDIIGVNTGSLQVGACLQNTRFKFVGYYHPNSVLICLKQ